MEAVISWKRVQPALFEKPVLHLKYLTRRYTRIAPKPLNEKAVILELVISFLDNRVIVVTDDIDKEMIFPRFQASRARFNFAQIDAAFAERF